MKNFLQLLFFSLFVILNSNITIGQTGTIRGSITDDATGDPIMFGAIIEPVSGQGTTSDLDGTYNLELTAGKYNLEFSYLGYSTLTISDVIVTSGEITIIDSRLKEDGETLEEVVITATQSRNTEAALATLKRKSTSVMDGISARSFKRSGDGNAAAAVKRVSGVSIEGGKYVYVRGLGDRYTKTVLNGMDIPGLDPDKNTVQMDIFPTNILDNIMVSKTFSAEYSGDFTGGIVNITTKDFPDYRKMNFSASLGYNPNMHFNSNYLSYQGSSTDFLGFDDGQRAIPTDRSTDIPTRIDALSNEANALEYNSILSKFNPTLGAMKSQSFMDYSIGFSTGDQIKVGENSIGYNLAVTYKNSTKYYENVTNSLWGKNNDNTVYDLDRREQQIGEYGVKNVLLGGLAGIAYKTNKSKFKLNLLKLQNGESKAGFFKYIGTNRGANYEADQHNLEYTQRSMTNLQLTGSHALASGDWNLSWALSPTWSSQIDPDIRNTRIRTENNTYTISTESGIPERIWRYLEEVNYVSKGDVTKKYSAFSNSAKLSFGGSYAYKMRDYEIQNFQVYQGNSKVTSDPNIILNPGNLFTYENKSGAYYDPQFIPNNPNKFEGNVAHLGGYVSTEINPTSKLKAVIGVRAENYIQKYTGINQANKQYTDEVVLDNLDILPATNFIYNITKDMNLRASYSRTLARPSFKEASYATIIDPITGRTFIGGFFPDIDVTSGNTIWDGNLSKTDIQNFDLRWELFEERGNGIALSGFYKTFKNPIEIIQYVQANNSFQPRNVGDGQVLGVELEIKKNLEFISKGLSNFSFNMNLMVADSKIEMSQSELQARINYARAGEEIQEYRDMAGQAPYLVNAGLSYGNSESGLNLSIFYNVQGSTLQYVGISDRPDVYTKPFHGLSLTASKTVGNEERVSLDFKIDNILDSSRESLFTSFSTEDQIFSSLSPGRQLSIGISYRIY